jgi:hypothetical protein
MIAIELQRYYPPAATRPPANERELLKTNHPQMYADKRG